MGKGEGQPVASVVEEKKGDNAVADKGPVKRAASGASTKEAPVSNSQGEREGKGGEVVKGATVLRHQNNPFAEKWWLFKLFINPQFQWHRMGGLFFLLCYASAWHLYLWNWEKFKTSPLIYILPLTGVMQSLSATYYFYHILPKNTDPGYYSDNSALSGTFVAENIFFASILAFQFIYMSDQGNFLIRHTAAAILGSNAATAAATSATAAATATGAAISSASADFFSQPLLSQLLNTLGFSFESFFVFFPYFARGIFPQTHFRDSMGETQNKSAKNFRFFQIFTWLTSKFYVFAKWFIGFGVNYLRFAGKMDGEECRKEFFRLLLFSSFATSISMFLHTLKFKGYLGPKTAFLIYVASYSATLYSMFVLRGLFFTSWPITALAAIGMGLNYLPRTVGRVWQVACFLILAAVRFGYLEIAL